MQRTLSILLAIAALACLVCPLAAQEKAAAPFPYLWAKAYHIPKETTTDESGYFSLCEGKDGKIYVGTAAYGRNAYLVEFTPSTEKMRVVIDAHKVLGLPLTPTGYAAQAKIHTRNFVGPSGKVYVGTKQGYRLTKEDTSEYPGGYVLIYDPKTDTTENLGMPYATQGVIDTVADEPRGLIYVVTCEEQHWMLYDMKSKKYRELGPLLFPYATTLIDSKGRANAITRDYSLARYDPATDKVTVIPMTLNGKPYAPDKRPDGQGVDQSWLPTWNLAADKRTAYLVHLSHTELYRIDLGGDETPEQGVAVTNLGPMIDGKGPDSRSSLTVAPDGRVLVTIKVNNTTGFGGGSLHHVISYDPRTSKMRDMGVLAVKNPDFFGRPLGQPGGATGDDGKNLPWTHGYHLLPDNTLTPLHAHMGLIAAHDGTLWATILYPYTLLKIDADAVK